MRNGVEWGGGGGLQGRGSGRFWNSAFQCFKVYNYFLTLYLVN